MSPDRFLTDASARFERTCATALPQIWLFRPSPHAWSPGDVVEHVTLANRNMARRLGRLEPIRAGSTDVIDEEIPYLFYRGDEPPNVATPSGTWTSWIEHADEYRESVRGIEQWAAENVGRDLRAIGTPHPVFGLLDGVQWLLFAGAHTERHRAQLIGLVKLASG